MENSKKLLTPNQLQLLEDNFEILSKEYSVSNKLELSSIIPIIGKPPIIPETHDMDSMLYAWEERAAYGRKIEFIENFIKEKLAS